MVVVDKTELTSKVPEGRDHRELKANGQQLAYVVLSPEEIAKGFVRPVRTRYVHKVCGEITEMSMSIAETYARNPNFYNGTFCMSCRKHFPLEQFRWENSEEQVGS